MTRNNVQLATFAGGCFWCTEAIFKRVTGIISVLPGYAGGTQPHPTYEDIHSNPTGHAESIQITFDPELISYNTLLEVFWATHDPTTVNRQGNDVGEEYRSVIFYHDEEQEKIARASKEHLEKEKKYADPIVTEITPYTNFYPAEENHKEYYDKNRSAPYCRFIIDPKVKKLLSNFADKIKDEYKNELP